MKQLGAFVLCAVFSLPVWAGGDSSDGHTHAPAEAIPVGVAAPRAVAASEEFEVVAVLEGNHLVVYVDRFASNEPVAKARVEVEGTGLGGPAKETAAGTYVVNLPAAVPPGKHPMTISIDAGDSADLLAATLDTSLATSAAVHRHGRSEWIVWGAGALSLLAAGALIIVRQRRKKVGGP